MDPGTIVNCSQSLCLNTSGHQDYKLNFTNGEYYYVDQDVSFWQIPQLAVLVGLFTFIVFGNTGVLIAIALSETGLKTRMNFFIANLAVADLAVGLFHVTVDLAERCLVVWHGGSALCKIVRFLQVLVVYASTFMIVSLSIDRVDAIARPMNFTRKATTIRALVIAAWIMSGLLAIPSIVLFDIDTLNNETHCIMTLQKHWHWQVYITLVALTAFVIPALIIIVCYSIIIYVIWDKGRGFSSAFQATSCRNPSSYNEIFCCRHESLNHLRRHSIGHPAMTGRNNNKGIIPQAKIRTLKMTLIIVCVFVLSWCPYFVFNLMDVYTDTSAKSMTHYAVTALIQSLAPLNSAANPIIYGLFGTRIFNGLRRIPCIAFCYNCSCRCKIKENCLQHRSSQYQMEHAYIEAASGKLVPILKRHSKYAGRHIGKCETSAAGWQSTLLTSNSAQTFVPNGNGTCKNTSCSSRHSNEISKDSESAVQCIYHRRSSGLPIVNRKMTVQESILLETYRPKFDKNGKAYDKVCRDEMETRDLLLHDTSFERFQRIVEVDSIDNSLQE